MKANQFYRQWITDYRIEKNDRSGEPIQDGDLLDWLAEKFESGEFKQLNKPVVGGPASASVSEGEQLATEAVDTGVWDGERCPRCKSVNLVDVDDHWTKCQDCKFSFVGG